MQCIHLLGQLIKYKNTSVTEKIGMLILDVKGNFHSKVEEYVTKYNRINDLIIIEPGGKYKYNPLNKPNLKAQVLANRVKNILLLFSPNNSESYWLDKVEQLLTECIKLCRLYNDGYVTWNFKVASNVKKGKYKFIINDEEFEYEIK